MERRRDDDRKKTKTLLQIRNEADFTASNLKVSSTANTRDTLALMRISSTDSETIMENPEAGTCSHGKPIVFFQPTDF